MVSEVNESSQSTISIIRFLLSFHDFHSQSSMLFVLFLYFLCVILSKNFALSVVSLSLLQHCYGVLCGLLVNGGMMLRVIISLIYLAFSLIGRYLISIKSLPSV